LLKVYPAIVSYFRSLQDCPHAIRDLLRLAPSDVIVDEHKVDVVELDLFFAHNVLATVEKSLLLLEKDSTSIIDVPNILNQLRENLNSRIPQKFFGVEATKKSNCWKLINVKQSKVNF